MKCQARPHGTESIAARTRRTQETTVQTLAALAVIRVVAFTALLAVLGATAAPIATAKTKLQVLVGFGTGGEPAQRPVQLRLAKAFEASHPDVTVEYLWVPWPAGPRFNTLLAAGMPPDVTMPIGMYGSNSYVQQGVWLDLNPLIQRDGLSLQRYFAPTLQASLFQGKRYGLPVGMYTDALFYNKDLFDHAGLPTPPHDYADASWTWDRFLECARKLTVDINGDGTPEQWGVDNVGNEEVLEASFGAHRYSPDLRKATFDSPQMIAAWSFIADLWHKYKVRPTYSQRVSRNLGGVGFPTGKFGMNIGFTGDALVFAKPALPFRWDLAANPHGPAGPKVLLYLDTANIVAESRNRELAWEWIKFIAQPENLAELAVTGYGAVPPTQDGAPRYIEETRKLLPGVDVSMFVKGAPYAVAVEYWRPQYQETKDLFDTAIAAVESGEADVPNTLHMINEKVQAILDKFWTSSR